MTDPSEPWYSVRCVFRHVIDGEGTSYEERVTVWRAASFDEAIALAEAEAAEYATTVECEYVELAQCFHLFVGEQLRSGDEVFSLLRDSPLEPTEYVDRFFDTGAERQR